MWCPPQGARLTDYQPMDTFSFLIPFFWSLFFGLTWPADAVSIPNQPNVASAAVLAISPEIPVASEAETIDRLARFAARLVEKNQRLSAARHGLRAARHEMGRQKAAFQARVDVQTMTGKSANRVYNTVTGIDEDYSTRRTGQTMGLGRRTRFGEGRLELERSRTDYTGSGASHFQSAYLAWETPLLQRPWKIYDVEFSRTEYPFQAERIRYDQVVQEVCLEGLRLIIERQVSLQHLAFLSRNLTFYQRMVEEAEIKLKSGLGSELDLKQARLRMQLAENRQREVALGLEEVARRLVVLMHDPEWEAEVASLSTGALVALVPASFSATAALEDARRQKPGLAQLTLERKQLEQDLAEAREKDKPAVNANLRWGRQGRASDPSMAREMKDKSWDLLVGYSTAIGPRPERLERRKQSEKLKSLAQTWDVTLAETRRNLEDQMERVRFFRRSLEDHRSSRALSAEVLEGQQLNFQLGKTTLLDLNRYQSDFEESCLAVFRAEAQLAQAWFGFLHEQGALTTFLAGELRKP